VAVTVLPKLSLAVQVITVTPVEKLEGASLLKVTLQLSEIVGVPRMMAQESETRSGGATITGGVVSVTVTLW
tara:strand:- start:394 stop:609 length:216 start_codon:yes stop_codon:yes gene_type:complete